jgi:hypothetical protein
MSVAAEERRRIEADLWQEPVAHARNPAKRTIAAALARYRVPGARSR